MSTNPAATVTVKSKPMNPKEILPAIPRQKVRNKFLRHDKIAHVLNVGADGKKVAVMTINPANLEEWNTEDCELVHEEPRMLRIGDQIAIINPNATNEIERHNFSRIEAIQGNNVIFAGGNAPIIYVRLASPQEIAKYFTA